MTMIGDSEGRLRTIKIAIVSDLHAFEPSAIGPKDPTPSWLGVGQHENSTGQNPIFGIKKLIKDESLTADYLLCPGDLSHQSHPSATGFAWKAVNEISKQLGAELIATPGNHDVDSRVQHNAYDAKGMLQELNPRFPVSADADYDRFWSRHFVLLERGDVRFLVINSSAYHGNSVTSNGTPEYQHGRLADRTLNAIKATLDGKGTLNIALCHHHPIPHEDFSSGAADIMQGGAELIKLLASGSFGEWLIVHGHKHMPKLSYAQATTSIPPVVFAAGSFSAKIHAEIAAIARNQFYILQLDLDEVDMYGLVGRFNSWDWINGEGWKRAQLNSGLPYEGGFGYRERPKIVATNIHNLFGQELKLTWDHVLQKIPQLAFLSPQDLQLSMTELSSSYGVTPHPTATGHIMQLDRKESP